MKNYDEREEATWELYEAAQNLLRVAGDVLAYGDRIMGDAYHEPRTGTAADYYAQPSAINPAALAANITKHCEALTGILLALRVLAGKRFDADNTRETQPAEPIFHRS